MTNNIIVTNERALKLAELRGYIRAVRDFGIWKNGVQTIGCLDTPVKTVVNRVLEENRVTEEEKSEEIF